VRPAGTRPAGCCQLAHGQLARGQVACARLACGTSWTWRGGLDLPGRTLGVPTPTCEAASPCRLTVPMLGAHTARSAPGFWGTRFLVRGVEREPVLEGTRPSREGAELMLRADCMLTELRPQGAQATHTTLPPLPPLPSLFPLPPPLLQPLLLQLPLPLPLGCGAGYAPGA